MQIHAHGPGSRLGRIGNPFFVLVLALVAGLVLAGLVLAGPADAKKSKSRAFEKVLFEQNGNYYELVELGRQGISTTPVYFDDDRITWLDAANLARRLQFKGVPGRLAQVDSPELDSFIRTALRPNKATWIGIGYHCPTGQLAYSDGQVLDQGAYTYFHPSDWGPRLPDGRPMCGSQGSFMGTYMAMGGFKAPFWAMNRAPKLYHALVVEYPIGEIARRQAADAGKGGDGKAQN